MAINYSLSARLSNPSDKNSEKRVYPIAQYQDLLDLKELAGHVAAHGSPFSKGTIMGILTDTVACIRENLLLGHKIQLGDMGAFFVTLSSEGAESADTFTPSLITGVNVRWAASDEFKSLLGEASFRQVATREIQALGRKNMREAVDEVLGTTPAEDGDADAGHYGTGEDGDVTD
ncbi:MAG: DNA-binding protein [Bacteroidaceae bacterium]|nr:DNA-binding protein [Bacteroidaceae bacterium]